MNVQGRKQVHDLYATVGGGRAEQIALMIVHLFAEDATLSRPESLPGGGVVAGRLHITKFFEAIAGSMSLTVVNSFATSGADGSGDQLFVELSIDTGSGPFTALEWWAFDGDLVISVRAFYWDTAQLVSSRKVG